MSVEQIKAALGEHVYRDVLGDYEIAPYYKHFGCSCGWEQNIAGMSGWRSWVEAHNAHVAEVIAALTPEASESVEYGIRTRVGPDPLSVTWDADLASEYADVGAPVFYRTRTTYAPTVTDWTEVAE